MCVQLNAKFLHDLRRRVERFEEREQTSSKASSMLTISSKDFAWLTVSPLLVKHITATSAAHSHLHWLRALITHFHPYKALLSLAAVSYRLAETKVACGG